MSLVYLGRLMPYGFPDAGRRNMCSLQSATRELNELFGKKQVKVTPG